MTDPPPEKRPRTTGRFFTEDERPALATMLQGLEWRLDRLKRANPVHWAPLAEEQDASCLSTDYLRSMARFDMQVLLGEVADPIFNRDKYFEFIRRTREAINDHEGVLAQRATLLRSENLWERFASPPKAEPSLARFSPEVPSMTISYDESRPVREVVFVLAPNAVEPSLFSRSHYASTHENVAFVCIRPPFRDTVLSMFYGNESTFVEHFDSGLAPLFFGERLYNSFDSCYEHRALKALMQQVSTVQHGNYIRQFHVPTSLVFHASFAYDDSLWGGRGRPWLDDFPEFCAGVADVGGVAIYLQPDVTAALLEPHFDLEKGTEIFRVTQEYAPTTDKAPHHPFVQHLIDTLPEEHSFSQGVPRRLSHQVPFTGKAAQMLPAWMLPKVDLDPDVLPPTCHVVHPPTGTGCVVYSFLPF